MKFRRIFCPFSIVLSLIPAAPALAVAEGHARVIVSPEKLPERADRPNIFLAGSIEMGTARNWQAEIISALKEENITFLNPRRADWNPDWKPVANDVNFRQQVEWELSALEKADIIIMYLAPGTQSPISLLELGLYARTSKIILLCPEGFWRKGNVDITAERYGITQVETFEALLQETHHRLNAIFSAKD